MLNGYSTRCTTVDQEFGGEEREAVNVAFWGKKRVVCFNGKNQSKVWEGIQEWRLKIKDPRE